MAKAKVETPKNMDPRFVAGTVVTLEQVSLKYVHLVTPDTEYQEEWSVHCKIDPSAVEEMRDIGFNVREDDGDGTYWLKVKRKVRTRAGKTQSPPVVQMDDGTPVTQEPGTGTIADVHLWCKYTDPIQGKVYMGAYLNGVTISDLKVFGGGGGANEVKF